MATDRKTDEQQQDTAQATSQSQAPEGTRVVTRTVTTERTAAADSREAHRDRVAMVSRTKDDEPDQSRDYELVLPDDVSDEERKAAENKLAR